MDATRAVGQRKNLLVLIGPGTDVLAMRDLLQSACTATVSVQTSTEADTGEYAMALFFVCAQLT